MKGSEVMVLAGEIARRDPQFRDRVVAKFGELLDELGKAMKSRPSRTVAPACDLCGDQETPKELRARCHMTAPLQASLVDGILTLRCYIPECSREVARFKVERLVE